MCVADIKPGIYITEREPGPDFWKCHYLIRSGMEVITPPGTVAPVGNRTGRLRVDQDNAAMSGTVLYSETRRCVPNGSRAGDRTSHTRTDRAGGAHPVIVPGPTIDDDVRIPDCRLTGPDTRPRAGRPTSGSAQLFVEGGQDVGDDVRVTLGRGRHHHRLAVDQLPPPVAPCDEREEGRRREGIRGDLGHSGPQSPPKSRQSATRHVWPPSSWQNHAFSEVSSLQGDQGNRHTKHVR
jgi:hypothetical protein